MLTPRLLQLWEAYEVEPVRKARLGKLDTFLDELTAESIGSWSDWARDLARRVVDEGETDSVPMPLFRRALFPVLLNGLKNNTPGHARWLAGFAQYLYRCPECLSQLLTEQRSEIGLLEAAIKVDPHDSLSAKKLMKAWAEQLSFRLYALPAGVLYGMDGATPDQCLELQGWAEEFSTIVEKLGEKASYSSLIEKCRFHFQAYRDYLLTREDDDTYAEYLESRGKLDQS